MHNSASWLKRLALAIALIVLCCPFFPSNAATAQETTSPIQLMENAEGLLTQAAEKFRQAQKKNEGSFFARAHMAEGRTRELLAQAQADSESGKKIREATISLFRQDAAETAPAFFDLGRALQANAQYEEAISAYKQYDTWCDARDKTVLFEAKFYPWGHWAPFAIKEGRVFYATSDPTYLVCAEGDTGKIIWSAEIAKPEAGVNIGIGDKICVAYGSDENIKVFDASSGELLRKFKPNRQPDIYRRTRTPFDVCVLNADKTIVTRCLLGDTNEISGIDATTGEIAWTHITTGHSPLSSTPFIYGNTIVTTAPPYDSVHALISPADGKLTEIPGSREFFNKIASYHPDGRIVIGRKYLIGPEALILDPADLSSKKEMIDPEKCSPYYSDDREKMIFADRKTRFVELRENRTMRPLWRYKLPFDAWHYVYIQGKLYAAGYRFICLKPDVGKAGEYRQYLSPLNQGICLAALKQWEACNAAFDRAEFLNSMDPELYWTWANLIPAEKEFSKHRFRLLDSYLRLSQADGIHRPQALAMLDRLSGLRAILPGSLVLYGEGVYHADINEYEFPEKHYLIFSPNKITAVDRKTLKQSWEAKYSGANDAYYNGEYICLAYQNGRPKNISYFDANTGEEFASAPLKQPLDWTSILAQNTGCNGAATCAYTLDRLHQEKTAMVCMDKNYKHELWRTEVINSDEAYIERALIYKDKLLLATGQHLQDKDSHRAACYDMKDGAKLWELRLPESPDNGRYAILIENGLVRLELTGNRLSQESRKPIFLDAGTGIAKTPSPTDGSIAKPVEINGRRLVISLKDSPHDISVHEQGSQKHSLFSFARPAFNDAAIRGHYYDKRENLLLLTDESTRQTLIFDLDRFVEFLLSPGT